MKKIQNLGKSLSKNEQKGILGGVGEGQTLCTASCPPQQTAQAYCDSCTYPEGTAPYDAGIDCVRGGTHVTFNCHAS